MKNRKLSGLLSMFLILGLAVFIAGGCGGGAVRKSEESAAIEISTAEELYAIRDDLTADYKLVADIDLSGYEEWEPIGAIAEDLGEGEYPLEDPDLDTAFTGSFDGNGHTISNISYNANYASVGLFGCIGAAEGTTVNIKDLTIENATIGGYMLVGSLVGYAYAADNASVVIENVTLTGDNTISGQSMVGGIVGGSIGSGVLIKGCTAEANMVLEGDFPNEGQGNSVGIIGGGIQQGNFEDCSVIGGTVTASGNGIMSVGALTGCAMESGYVRGCSASSVTITVDSDDACLIGGLIGYSGDYNEGSVTEISGCKTDNVVININGDNAKRIGMILGGGFYHSLYAPYASYADYGEEYAEYAKFGTPYAFTLSDCAADGDINGDDISIVGTIAGYVYTENSSVDESSCSADVTVNGESSGQMVGGTEESDPLDTL